MADTLTLKVSGGIAQLEMNRPQQSNSFDLQAARTFAAAVRKVESDEAVRVLLLTGAGKRFCAGGDVASMVVADDRNSYLKELAEVLDGALQHLDEMAKPVVVAVHGAVAGAGIGVMLAGDFVVAERSTKFLTAYAGIGLTPDCGVSWLLPRAIGQQRALQLALTPKTLDGDEALAWGLVSEIVDEDANGRARAVAEELAAGPTRALGQTRRLIRSSWSVDRARSGADESVTISKAVTEPEAAALIERFVSVTLQS